MDKSSGNTVHANKHKVAVYKLETTGVLSFIIYHSLYKYELLNKTSFEHTQGRIQEGVKVALAHSDLQKKKNQITVPLKY